MEKSAANEAMRDQREVVCKGRRYQRINAIIARRFTGGSDRTMGELLDEDYNNTIQLELYDGYSNSVVIAQLQDVELA